MARIFEKYEIVRRIAYGGMGEVFLARQVGEARFDRLVILKSLRPELAEDSELVEEFLEEARLAATLNHPNIVSIYEVGRSHDTYFIAMELIRGEDLFRLCQAALAQDLWLPTRVAVHIVRDAALGLDAAHRAETPAGMPLHIVHRDVTPRNLMVRTDGVTKVVDFGLAKAIDRAARTITGGLKGTIAYMSPEQAFAAPLDARSDQFSLGVVLWELLAKRRLFGGKDSIEVLEAARNLTVRPPSDYQETVPRVLDDVVMRMLSRDKEGRFPSCRLAADAMSAYLGDLSGPSGQERVAAFVQSVAGDAIEARLADLTPVEVSLIPTEVPTRPPVPVPARGVPVPGWMVGVGATALVVGVSVALLAPPGEVPLPPLPALEPVVSKPAVSDPAVSEPAVSEPAVSDPAVSEPAVSDPAVSDPAVSDPAVSDPAVSEPESPAEEPRTVVASASPTPPVPAPADRAPAAPSRRPRQPPGAVEPAPAALPVETAPPGGEPVPTTSSGTGQAEDRAPAVVTLDTKPWTQVSVDGVTHGATPLYREELSPGRHMLHLVNPEAGIDVWRELVVEPGQVLHLTWDLIAKP